ncbi:MAG: hypothetical protein N839_0009825 [Desulfofustis sp. PB-SRB1]|jgi:hypothetical protein|nr:hypothetical protein [Desulfofustis sp. PB-SRB1]MBM1002697.1 hypothetical protein [Desulfofustis sp. PB-SRB1]HBH29708.1 hypothetical protein [Desulfofustis sp.]HBH32638.1 hypothetical protein [Desulfofustis sp.]
MAATYARTHNELHVANVRITHARLQKISEYFWFSLCFVLFLVLGPFAAPIALCFLFSKQVLGVDMREPESIESHS